MEQHGSYLKSMKNTAEYKSLLDYTGFSAKFVKINSYIRVPSPKSYASVGKDDAKVKDFVNSTGFSDLLSEHLPAQEENISA